MIMMWSDDYSIHAQCKYCVERTIHALIGPQERITLEPTVPQERTTLEPTVPQERTILRQIGLETSPAK